MNENDLQIEKFPTRNSSEWDEWIWDWELGGGGVLTHQFMWRPFAMMHVKLKWIKTKRVRVEKKYYFTREKTIT